MALSDIIQRIDRDADSEASELLAAAEEQSATQRGSVTAEAEADKVALLAKSAHQSEQDARTLVAAARLRGRDRVLAEKRVLIRRALDQAVASIEALDDALYAKVLATGALKVARGGEIIRPASADAARLAGTLQSALSAVGLAATVGDPAVDIARGILVQGDRVRAEVSARAMVDANRSELEALVAEKLFGGDE
ncbi:MAG: hypothetical protein KJ747_01615 [Actinobacteria bacterium]|nr:hypothetical protein [Actinomycetota bacterium]MCG2806801.1 hypothetical protein [Coriobacteriia bacterium]